MNSSLMDSPGNLRGRGAQGKGMMHMACTYSQSRGHWIAAGDPETVSTETIGNP